MRIIKYFFIFIIIFTVYVCAFPARAMSGVSSSSGISSNIVENNKSVSLNDLKEDGYKIERTNIYIKGMTKRYTFIYLSDLHMINVDNDVNVNDRKLVKERYDKIRSLDERNCKDTWIQFVDKINAFNPDGVLFGGDMIDYASKRNVEELKKGIKRLQVPYMFVRADHDLEPWWCTDTTTAEQAASYYSSWSNPVNGVFKLEYPEFMVVGWDNSTYQMSNDTLEEMKAMFGMGKPIILLTHVPINSKLDTSLGAMSVEMWGRNLTWGKDAHYVPNEVTAQFIKMIFAKNSPVCGVLSGHLHNSWEGKLNYRIKEHVFDAAYEGAIGLVTVSGKKTK